MVAAKHHDRAEFLDLDISVERSQVATRAYLKLKFRPFRKPCNRATLMPTDLLPPTMLDMPSEDGHLWSYSHS